MNENSILKTEISILLESFPKTTGGGGECYGCYQPNFSVLADSSFFFLF